MKKVFIIVIMLLVAATALSIQSCNSDDDVQSEGSCTPPYGKWLLLGYGSDKNYIGKENNWTENCFLILQENGSLEGNIGNDFVGMYTFTVNGEFAIYNFRGSLDLFTNPHIVFIEDQICGCKIKSYKLSDNELKLFYSSSEYLKFRKE